MTRNHTPHTTPRENFLMALLHKVTKEYKALLDYTRRTKLLKVIEIIKLSDVPGETELMVQIAHKNCALKLTAAQILHDQYPLDDFSPFHAEIIRQAAQGTLKQFLAHTSTTPPHYKIICKKWDKLSQQTLFTLETDNKIRLNRTAHEIAQDKSLLAALSLSDVYDIGFTQGAESILQEKMALLLAKNSHAHCVK